MMNLSGKVSLITGGAQGLGKLFSENLLRKGAKVCIVDIDQHKGETTVSDLTQKYGTDRAVFVKCDVTSKEEFENAFKRAKSEFGKIDIVCNNAGIASEIMWRKMIDINLTAVIQGTFLGMEYMGRDKGHSGGVIINISSTAGLLPVDFTPCYAASKAGVVNFTRSSALSRKNKLSGIRFCCLCPSFAATDILNAEIASDLDLKSYKKALDYIGIMEPETVAEAFMELVEDEGNNGSVLSVTKHHGKQYIPPPPNL